MTALFVGWRLKIALHAIDRAIRNSAFHDPHATFQDLRRRKSLQAEIVRATRALVVQETDTRAAMKERVKNHTIAQWSVDKGRVCAEERHNRGLRE
jgi:hypothetical protein